MTKSLRDFRNKRTQSTPLDPKLTFLCVSYHLVAFGTIWLPYETRCKTGWTTAKVCATKTRGYFLQRTHSIRPIGPQTDVLVHFGLFGCIRDRLVALPNSVQNRPKYCKSSCHEVGSEFLATNAPNPLHWTLNRHFGAFCTIWVHSGPFGCLTKLGAKWPNYRKSSSHEVASEYFTTNALDPPHWIPN